MELTGEKIERLLWEAGCDFSQVENDGGEPVLHVTVGENTVELTELWFEDGSWFVDSDTLELNKLVEGEAVAFSVEEYQTEEQLVQGILDLGE